MRWDGDGDGANVGDDVDDDLDDARDDGDDDGDDLPFREVFSPAESARRRWLLFSIGFCHGAAAKLSKFYIFRVFTPRGRYRPEGGTGGGTRTPGGLSARPRGATPRGRLGPW